MGKVRILAVEDDELHFSKIELLVEEMGYELIAQARDAEEALRLIKATSPDIILMDIDIEGETDGIALARTIGRMSDIPIIFTTAFQDPHTIQKAVATAPQAYLTKPISRGELQASIELVIYNDAQANEPIHQAFSNWEEDIFLKGSFFVKLSDRLEKVRYQDVMWFESAEEEKYVNMRVGNESLKIRTSLKKIQSKLPQTFVRINSSQLINGERIQNISDVKNTVNVDGHDLHLSRKYKKDILNLLTFLN